MADHFDKQLLDSDTPAVADFSAPSDTLLIAFGGIAAGLGMPPFEFFRLAGELPVKKMFIRDIGQAWYQRGLVGISSDVRSTAAYLAARIADSKAARTVMIGNSMGGYAAILFAALVGVDTVHAFSPQTFIGRWTRLANFDRRWRREMRRLHRTRGLSHDYFDLRSFLRKRPSNATIHLHFAAQHRLDRLHCRRLDQLPGVVVHPYPGRDHKLIKRLRDDGTLAEIVRQSLFPRHARAA